MSRLTIQPANATEHGPLLVDWVTSSDVLLLWTGTRFEWPLTCQAITEHMSPQTYSPSTRRMVIGVDCQTKQPIAYAEIIRMHDQRKRHARLARIIVSPHERGKGYGTEFVSLLIEHSFDKLHLDFLDLYVFLHNKSAISVYRRVGFREEDILVKSFRNPKGELLDLLRMGMRRSTWLIKRGRSGGPY